MRSRAHTRRSSGLYCSIEWNTCLGVLRVATIIVFMWDPSLSHEEALALIRELKTFPLLDGFRGRPRADIEALASAIVAFARMATELGSRLIEAAINPIFVLPEGQGVRAADGVAVIGEVCAEAASRSGG